ncbi:MAG: hypothetical protein HIU83_06865 [Proteobacteria bacterium]|nr:hypothetical protein [Pseudomonadota bacterium]
MKHSRCILFVTFMIPLFLVFAGTRVPDFSHPHSPKPMRRAVLDKTPVQTVLQSVVKIDVDPCIVAVPSLAFLVSEEPSPEMHHAHAPVPLLSPSPFPPRAPPASNPPA